MRSEEGDDPMTVEEMKKHFRWNILYLQIILDETAKHLEKFSWKKARRIHTKEL